MNDNDQNSNRSNDSRIRKRYSLVWKFFEKLSISRVKCRVCQHEQKYLGNTANALRHLKVKHDVDARAVGLSDAANVKRMNALIDDVDIKKESLLDYHLGDEAIEEGDKRDVQKNMIVNRLKSESDQGEETEIDPYSDAEHVFQEFAGYRNTPDKYGSNTPNKTTSFKSAEKSREVSNKKRNTNLLDDRLIAETEYFREKAAYYRIQKHLAAIQAKRAKYELDELLANK